jgi:hypothetical protein
MSLIAQFKTASRLSRTALATAYDYAASTWMRELNNVINESNLERVHIADDEQTARLRTVWKLSGVPEAKFKKHMERMWSMKNKGQRLIIGKLS